MAIRITQTNMRLLSIGLVCAALIGAGLGWRAARSESAEQCFAETGYCIGGRVREVWLDGGGLRAFGLPITPLQEEEIEGQLRVVQWFERARFELHLERLPPYDVQLGRLGADLLVRHGLAWEQFPHPMPLGNCRIFPETGHAVCDAFLAAWQASGLNLDGNAAGSDAESLALFGLPLSSLRAERLSDGRLHVVQWFERARFELHPDLPPPYNVLFGLLGNEMAPPVRQPWTPPVPPTSPPVNNRPPAGAIPNRLVIPAIELDRAIVPVGMRGIEYVVPDLEVGWFDQSALPGQGENIVLWGHVLPFLYAPAAPPPFARLKELPVGAPLTLYDRDGQAHHYRVTQQVTVLPHEVEYILPGGREQLTMVSCIGDNVFNAGNVVDMSHRLITIAEPVH